MLNWNEKFETGHELIDTQHRMLISYINRLDVMAGITNPTATDIELFSRFIEFLESYILTHFTEEDDCMFRFRCSAYKDNKRAHAEFLDFFRGFQRRFVIEGYSAEAVKELFEACKAWIQSHILKIDVQLKPCRKPFYELDDPESSAWPPK
jgi:hemerythrin